MAGPLLADSRPIARMPASWCHVICPPSHGSDTGHVIVSGAKDLIRTTGSNPEIDGLERISAVSFNVPFR